MSPLSVIILDCDGVILESVEAKTRAFAQLYHPFGAEVERFAVDFHLANGGVSRFEKFRAVARRFQGRDTTPQEEALLGARFTELCLAEVLASPLVPGALEFILAARAMAPVYVASGTPQEELAHIMQVRGMADLFAGVFGTPPAKADLLRRILALENAAPAAAVLLGDSGTDLAAARETGVGFWGRGLFPGEACGPDLHAAMSLLEAAKEGER